MKAVIYTRVSTVEQVENFSLETQLTTCQAYCTREGIEVAAVFTDEGKSAKSTDRPELQELLKYCQDHRKSLDFVVVYDVSRFSRHAPSHIALRATLQKWGISLRSATQQFDDSSTGEFMELILSAMAHLDNRQRADRTKDGMRASLVAGRWTHIPPVGYRKPLDSHNAPSLEPDPEQAPHVRQAFELIATGRYSKRRALEEVTALGLRTRRGTRMSNQSFASLLHNPIYAGRMRVKAWGFEGPGDFEPIVSEELFAAVQAVLNGRKPATSRHLHGTTLTFRCADSFAVELATLP